MEEKQIPDSERFSQDFGDTEDVLSLCNLPIHGHDHEDASLHSRLGSASPDPDLFEFSGSLGSEMSRTNSVVFCGNIVDQSDAGEVNEYRKRDYFCVKCSSFQKARDYQLNDEDGGDCRSPIGRDRSYSSSSELFRHKQCSPVQKVNITAITSMSAKSRRRMFMFGPVKFKPEMDVIAIKKRQGRRPTHIPPMPKEGEMVAAAVGDGRRGKSGGDGELTRPFWCTSHLATALARSFGCISASMV
ncbi:hypothetical protein U1Q18_022036 [Sarracenia purpurea var. burkii]